MQTQVLKVGAGLLACGLLFGSAASAADIYGAWANSLAVCSKVFVKRGDAIAVAKGADTYGSGFIIDKNRIRGRTATCFIKSRKDEAGFVQLIAACSTDIALSTVQFSLKLDGDNKLTRTFAGLPEMEVSYTRCPL